MQSERWNWKGATGDAVRDKKTPMKNSGHERSTRFTQFQLVFFPSVSEHANGTSETRHTSSNRMRNKYCKWTHFNVEFADLSCCRCVAPNILFYLTHGLFMFHQLDSAPLSRNRFFSSALPHTALLAHYFMLLPFLAQCSREPIFFCSSLLFRVESARMRLRAHVIYCDQTIISNMQATSGTL